MDDIRQHVTSRAYEANGTCIYEYSRGLNGTNTHRNILFIRIMCISVIFVTVFVLCGRIAQMSHAYLRLITSLTASRRQQRLWSIEESFIWVNIKKHILYSPLGRKRHNQEIRLSSAVNVGNLPSRLQAILIALYIVSQVIYCSLLDYDVDVKAALFAELRARSGTLAVFNMVPLFLFAGRNNPLIPLLRVSFDTFNCLHRWLGRIIVLEGMVHTTAWAINTCDTSFSTTLEHIRDTPFFIWGLVGIVLMIFLFLHSLAPIRHAFYEIFLHLHQLAAFLALLGVYAHLDLDGLPQKSWAKAVGVLWLLERSVRLLRLIYINISSCGRITKLIVHALPGEACRATFHIPKRIRIQPGSHVYVYIPSVSMWMSHPFSIAWTEPTDSVSTLAVTEKAFRTQLPGPRSLSPFQTQAVKTCAKDSKDRDNQEPTSFSIIVSARQGMTRKLYSKVLASPGKTLYTSGYIEGPYGTHASNMGSYGTVVLFSAGAGITHHLLHVRDLIIRASEGLVTTQQIYLTWSVRNTEHLSWVQEWIEEILHLSGRRKFLIIKIFVSNPKNSREIVFRSKIVQMFPGRCRPDVVLSEVLPQRVGATLISVCGPGGFADEVRATARKNIGKGAVVDFVVEAFTW